MLPSINKLNLTVNSSQVSKDHYFETKEQMSERMSKSKG